MRSPIKIRLISENKRIRPSSKPLIDEKLSILNGTVKESNS